MSKPSVPVRTAVAGACACAILINAGAQEAPFGDNASVDYASRLWDALEDANLVGDGAVRSHAFIGSDPHGVVLEQTERTLTVGDTTAPVVVKHNWMRPDADLTTDEVTNSPWRENLVAVTVMFKRGAGYNPEADDWFWVKYLPDGSLDRTPGNVPMAGRVQGCIQCHQDASGDDFVFMHDRYSED